MSNEWTDEDKAIAVAMKRVRIPAKDIAARLGRTVSSVSKITAKAKAKRRLDGRRGAKLSNKFLSVVTMHDSTGAE